MMTYRRRSSPPDVVTDVEQQAHRARRLEQVADQDLLNDPHTNPATRGHRDRLRNDQQRHALDLAHRRRLRQGRVDDRRASYAERALQATWDAREIDSPALAVLTLERVRRRYMALALGASVMLSIGAAMGAEAWVAAWNGPTGAGYIAEVGMTGLSTTAILLAASLAAKGASTGQPGLSWLGWLRWILAALIVLPLVGSVVASTAGTGPVGAACSLGAAAFSALAYLVGDATARAMRRRAAEVTAEEEADLRDRMRGDFFTAMAEPSQESPDIDVRRPLVATDPASDDQVKGAVSEAEAWVRSQAHASIEQIAAWLARPETKPTTASQNGQNGACTLLRDESAHRVGAPDAQQVHTPTEARRAAILAYRKRHPEASVSEIARNFEVSRRTVNRALETSTS